MKKLLENLRAENRPRPQVKFTDIELISADEKEWVLSFKGTDQPGLLAAASQALADREVSVKSAKVHTWGRQIEDVFIIKPSGDAPSLIDDLRRQFVG